MARESLAPAKLCVALAFQHKKFVNQADQNFFFITAVEGCIDAAHHVAASAGWAAPDSNAAAMRGLAAHGVLDAALGEAMARAVAFRNILVHGYRQVDDGVVVDSLTRLRDFDAFVGAVAKLIDGS